MGMYSAASDFDYYEELNHVRGAVAYDCPTCERRFYIMKSEGYPGPHPQCDDCLRDAWATEKERLAAQEQKARRA